MRKPEEIRAFECHFLGPNVVELGGGSNRNPVSKLNLDVRKVEGVDIVADFEKLLPLKTGVYDGVYSQFVIEHISIKNVPQFISEIYRILKPTGKAIVATMNLRAMVDRLSKLERWELNDVLCIFRGEYPEDLHKSGFSPDLAVQLFTDAGFQTVRVSGFLVGGDPLDDYYPDMVIEASKQVVEFKPFEDEFKPYFSVEDDRRR